MKFSKGMIAIFMALLLLCPLLASCGNKPEIPAEFTTEDYTYVDSDWTWTDGADEEETTTEPEPETETEPATFPVVNTTRYTTTRRKTTTTRRTTTTKKTTTKNKNPITTIPDGKVSGTAAATTTTTKAGQTTTAPATTTATYIKVNGVMFTGAANYTIERGKTQALNFVVSPSSANNKAVAFDSGNRLVATVSASGVVTATGAGTTTITIRTMDPHADQNYTDSVTITVVEVPMVDFDLYGNGAMQVGQSYTFSVRNFKGEGGRPPSNTTVTWSSSDSTVATVSSSGVVTAKNPGECRIIATANDANHYSKEVRIVVTL
jgi:hypothetical protein